MISTYQCQHVRENTFSPDLHSSTPLPMTW